MSRTSQVAVLTGLIYLVVLGSFPLWDRLGAPGIPEGFHQRHNAHVSWQLFHIPGAFLGVIVALWLLKFRPIAAGLCIGALTLQITLALAEYRRVGYNAAGSRDITVGEFIAAAAMVAAPFALIGWAALRVNTRKFRR